jgi:hypothetical protein
LYRFNGKKLVKVAGVPSLPGYDYELVAAGSGKLVLQYTGDYDDNAYQVTFKYSNGKLKKGTPKLVS